MAPRLAFRRPLVLWTALVALGWRPLHLAQGLLLSLGLGLGLGLEWGSG